MWPIDRAREWLDRVEMRLALRVALVTVLVAAATVVVAYVEASDEILEEVEGDLSRELELLAERAERDPTEWERVLAPFLGVLHEQKRVLRWLAADGATRDAWGTWPAPSRVIPRHASKLDALRASPDDFAAREVRLPDGSVLQAATSLSHFVGEREEFRRRLLLAFGFSLLVAGAVSAWLTRSALAPLRRATLAVEGVDESGLEARIPTRGTGDVVDRHAEALNRVLARLEWAFARMRGFSADAAHELRTPVNRILTVADVAALQETDPTRWHDALLRIREGAEEMRRLLDALFLLARGEEGRLALQRSRVALLDLLGQLAELYRPLADERDVDLSVEGEPLEVSADRDLLARAASNLLENAIRCTPPGGKIRIEVQERPEGVAIVVCDSGEGVTPTERDRIFERFTQLDPARTSGGGGLGLPITRMIARLHGGEAWAGDSPLGGAAFTILLPGDAALPAPESSARAARPHPL
jgi:two-component system heavy metal sensor histidine kinase CusS